MGKKPQFSQKTVNRMLREQFGETVTFADLDKFAAQHNYYPFYIRKDPAYRLSRGTYRVPTENEPLSTFGPETEQDAVVVHKSNPDTGSVSVESAADAALAQAPTEVPTREVTNPALAFRHDADLRAIDIQKRMQQIAREASLLATVPTKLKSFVPFGDFDMIRTIVSSKVFFPVFITGLSGNGKTLFAEQACAMESREHIQVDITTETDEDDLIGGFRLRNGETYFELGPAAVAMIRGAVLVLNELDLASPKIMCLQSVIDGKPLTIKKLGVVIQPAQGFTVFATANTKGRGDENGKFIGTGLLNEAFLERFPVTIEQEYPSVKIEKSILEKTYESVGGVNNATSKLFFDTLSKWAEAIRKTYDEQGIEDVISTRRLCHVARAYKIFGDQEAALSYCTNRFDGKVRDAFLDLYNKLVPDPTAKTNVGKAPSF